MIFWPVLGGGLHLVGARTWWRPVLGGCPLCGSGGSDALVRRKKQRNKYIYIICVIVSLYAGLHFAECEWELATTSCVLKIVFGRDVVFI